LGQVYDGDANRRRALLFWVGIALCVGFVALRFANVYGDPVPWSPQKSALWTMISFLNTNKYPPSLLFLLMTLGPALLLLRAFDHSVPALLRPALIIGKVPLFFYVLHFYLIHRRRELPTLRRDRRDAPVARPRPFPFQRASGLGKQRAGGVLAVGTCRLDYVPTLSLVRGREEATQRLVAQLPLSKGGHRHHSRTAPLR
jgi:hypothetical protein